MGKQYKGVQERDGTGEKQSYLRKGIWRKDEVMIMGRGNVMKERKEIDWARDEYLFVSLIDCLPG